MTVIRQEDLIESVADALQFISYYHPKDFIEPFTRPISGKNPRRPRMPWRRS